MNPTEGNEGASALGVAFFRAIVFSVVLDLAFVVYFVGESLHFGSFRGDRIAVSAFSGFAFGLVPALPALVELRMARRSPSIGRDAVAAALTAATAFAVLALVAFPNLNYTFASLGEGSAEAGVRAVRSLFEGYAYNPLRWAAMFAFLSAPAIPVVVARLRGLGLASQTAVAIVGFVVLAAPSALYLASHTSIPMVPLWASSLVAAAVMPAGCRLADALERRAGWGGPHP